MRYYIHNSLKQFIKVKTLFDKEIAYKTFNGSTNIQQLMQERNK